MSDSRFSKELSALFDEVVSLASGGARSVFDRMQAIRLDRLLQNYPQESKDFLPSVDEPRTIVFNTVRTKGVQPWIEFTLAYLLASAGHETYVLYDDGLMGHWDDVQSHNLSTPHDGTEALTDSQKAERSEFRSRLYRFNLYNRIRAFRHPNLTVCTYSDLIDEEGISDTYLPENHDRHITSSVIRFFGTEDVDWNAPEVTSFCERCRRNNLVSSSVGRHIMEVLDTDCLFTSHGIYSTWGCCFDVASENGILSLVYGVLSSRPHHIWIFDTISQNVIESPRWRQRKRSPITEKEKQLSERFLQQRFKKETPDNRVYFSNVGRGKLTDDVIRFASGSKGGNTFGMFPNVPWDGKVDEQNTIFDDVLGWVINTIRQFKENSNKLVIRFHPSEETMFDEGVTLSEEVKKKEDVTGEENILSIESAADIDTYRLLEFIDAGLVYDGTLAVEMPFFGVPVIAGGQGRFSQPEWVYLPESPGEYRQWISDPDEVLRDFAETRERRLDKAKKFVYWYYFKSAYDFPLLDSFLSSENGGLKNGLSLSRPKSLEPAMIYNDRYASVLRRVCKALTRKKCTGRHEKHEMLD